MLLDRDDADMTIRRYAERYGQYGYSPKTLGWDKGKQDVRFHILTDGFDCRGKSMLDIGCGFGDLNLTLRARCGQEYSYLGVDLVDTLLAEGRQRYENERVHFTAGNFLELPLAGNFDIGLASGVFNHRLAHSDSYTVIEATMAKAFGICREGIAFDFLSDKVDYQHEHTFHSSPERILAMAYHLSRNVVLRNDYMPFEFAVYVFKDDGFDKSDTLFRRYKNIMSKGGQTA